MCYTGKCPYENYLGDCEIHDRNYPDDANCVIAETEILKHYYREAQNDFQYLVVEAAYREKVIQKLKNASKSYEEESEEDFELSIFVEISNIMNDEKLRKEYERM